MLIPGVSDDDKKIQEDVINLGQPVMMVNILDPLPMVQQIEEQVIY